VGITIAIDGYSSCGKSTLAKALANRLGYRYIDTGAMYRAVCWHAVSQGFFNRTVLNINALIDVLPQLDIVFKYNAMLNCSEVYLNGQNIEAKIRTLEISNLVTQVSKLPEVRRKMVSLQRDMGKQKAIVMDGRDIGSHVFPNAELKIFMQADMQVRAERRLQEHQQKGEHVLLQEVIDNLKFRDHEDMTRSENPLIKTADAFVLDNTFLTREAQLERILQEIKNRNLL
jgi:cytidylate kinase